MKPLDFSEIKYNALHFVIMNAPTDKNIHAYVKKLKSSNVSTIVRVCEPTYNIDPCTRENIKVEDHPFNDGHAPPRNIIETWLDIVNGAVQDSKAIAVHCVAGLGRAPVLVVIALIEYGGLQASEAITFVRKNRLGAINKNN
eukprot:UN25987